MLHDSRTGDWSPFVLFITAATGDDRQIALGRLAQDGSWCGFELVQEFPSLGSRDVHVWLGDGPILCVHDGDGAIDNGRMLVLCRASGSAWQHCLCSLSLKQEASSATAQCGSNSRAQSWSLLYCGPLPAMHSTAGATSPPSVLLARGSREGDTQLRWLIVEPTVGDVGLNLAARPPVSLPHSYCTAQPCSICWSLAFVDQRLDDQSGARTTGACFVGLENGRLLKLNALEILSTEENNGQAVRLLHSRDLVTAGPKPVLHVRLAMFDCGGEAELAAEVLVAQQRSTVHLISVATLSVLKSINLSPHAPSMNDPAEQMLRHSVLLNRCSEGCAGGTNQLILVDVSAAAHNNKMVGLGDDTRGQWKVSTAGSFALHADDLVADSGGEARMVGRHGINWQHDYSADASVSQDTTGSQLTQELTQLDCRGAISRGDEDSNAEMQAIESFAASLQDRLRLAQHSLHHMQRLLVEKGSLLRYTQKMLIEMAAGFAVGANMINSNTLVDEDAKARAQHNRIARTGLRPLIQPSNDAETQVVADEARHEAAMAAKGFIPTGFAGLAVPNACAESQGNVAVVSITQHTVAGGGNHDGSSLDLCLEISVRNVGKHPVHDVSITVLPWRCAASCKDRTPASLTPLPSLSTGLRELSSDSDGTIQAVVEVSELLGFKDNKHAHSDFHGNNCQQRVSIGSPRGRCVSLAAVCLSFYDTASVDLPASPLLVCSVAYTIDKIRVVTSRRYHEPTAVSLHLLVTWQDSTVTAKPAVGKFVDEATMSKAAGTARGVVHGPITLDMAQLLQPGTHKSSCATAEPMVKRQRSDDGAESGASLGARHVGLEHVQILLCSGIPDDLERQRCDDENDGETGVIDVDELAMELEKQSGLQRQAVVASDDQAAVASGVLLHPPSTVEAPRAQLRGGMLSGVSSLYLSAYCARTPERADGMDHADSSVQVDADTAIDAAEAAAQARSRRYARLVSCQLWYAAARWQLRPAVAKVVF